MIMAAAPSNIARRPWRRWLRLRSPNVAQIVEPPRTISSRSKLVQEAVVQNGQSLQRLAHVIRAHRLFINGLQHTLQCILSLRTGGGGVSKEHIL